MVEIRIGNVEALGKPLGQYSHLARVKNASKLGKAVERGSASSMSTS